MGGYTRLDIHWVGSALTDGYKGCHLLHTEHFVMYILNIDADDDETGQWLWSADHQKNYIFQHRTNVNSLGFTINANAQSQPKIETRISNISDLVSA